jgi:hypothetical protein
MKKTKTTSDLPALEIPDVPDRVSADLSRFSFLFYGPVKVGKSKLISTFPGVVFCQTEPGLRFISARKTLVNDWISFKLYVKLVEKKARLGKLKLVAIDTVDNLYRFCYEYVAEREGWSHPSEEGFGKGYDAIESEFRHWVTRLTNGSWGVCFISHAKEAEVKSRSTEITKTMPTLPKTGLKVISPICDFIFYLGFRTDVSESSGKKVEVDSRRVVVTKPSETLEAGDRSGLLPKYLPLKAKVIKAEIEKAVAEIRRREMAKGGEALD